MCNQCNQNICECGKTVVLLNPAGGSASMTNVGALLPMYVTGTSVPFEMRTIGAEAPSNNILDYGFQAVQTATEITLKYNPLRGNTLFVDATFGDDLTALPNHEDACYQTITGAVAAASSGDLIIVNAGFYDCAAAVGDVLLWKDGVNIYCHPNVQLNVGTINWDFAMTINVDTGIYGYAEMYIDSASTSPTPFVEGFLSGFDVPVGYLGEQIPTTTLEINNLYFTNAVDFQHLIVRYKSNVYIRNNIYGNKIGAGASWVYVEGNTNQINVRFTTCYNAPAYEVGQLLNVDPIDIMVNVEYKQILTKGYDPLYGVVRLRKNAANGYPVAVASVAKNNPINVKLNGDIIHENTTIPVFSDAGSHVFSLTDNVWAEYTGKIEQKYDVSIIRNDGDSISASYNTLFKFKDSTIIMPDDDASCKTMIYTSRGNGDEVQEIYVLDNCTIIMSRATAVLAVSTIYRWENTNAGSFVDFLCYGLKTNVDCTSAATMFDNVAANTVTLDTSLTFISFSAYINN